MISIHDMQEVGPGVFYVESRVPLVSAGADVVDHLKAVAASIPVRRARLCAHPEAEAEQQDMLIVSHHETYVAPHRHKDKSETMVILDGLADAYLFEPDGAVDMVLPMGPLTSGRTFFYRMLAGRYHGLNITSEFLTFIESTKGPFRKSDSEVAPWAPRAEEVNAGRRFVERLTRVHGNLPRGRPGDAD